MSMSNASHLSDTSLDHWRQLIFVRLFSFFAILGVPVYITSVYLFYIDKRWLLIGLDTVFYLHLLTVLYGTKFSDKTRYIGGCLLAYFIGASMLFAIGPTGAGFFWLFMFPPLASILLGNKEGIYAQLLNTFSLISIGVCYKFGLLNWPSLPDFNVMTWWVICINFLVVNGILTLSISYLLDKLSSSIVSIQASRQATVIGLARLAEYRDNETGAHLLRMRQYAQMLARQFATNPDCPAELTPEFVNDIALSAILHDIGKVGIADSILLKPGKLTDEEYAKMQAHPTIGSSVIQSLRQYAPRCSLLKMGEDIASGHHEKWDGSGYPLGLTAEQIPLAARIVALADVYDALTSPRCYKKPFCHAIAMKMILEGRGSHFDPAIVDALLVIEADFERLSLASLKDENQVPSDEVFGRLPENAR